MKKDLKDCRVLVTPTSFGKSDPQIKRLLEESVGEVEYNLSGKPLTAAELSEKIKGFDGYIAGLDYISAEVFEAADELQVISRYGVGVDRVDLQKAAECGIVVTNTPGANAVAVAELTLTFIMLLARQVHKADKQTHAGEWPRFNGLGLRGRTIGLVGFGAIGQEVAKRLKGFEVKVLVFDPFVNNEIVSSLGVASVSMDELLQKSDFVSLHAPLTPDTKGLAGIDFFCKMKPGAFLINTARGELIEDAAFEEALKNGHLAGAAIDVFSKEPPEKENFVFNYPQVIVTPHMSSHTDDAVNQMGWMALNNCLAVLKDEEPINPVRS